jgi:hypothetical protein
MNDTETQTYNEVLKFMSTVPVVCEESLQLIAHLWHKPLDVVRHDVETARNPSSLIGDPS